MNINKFPSVVFEQSWQGVEWASKQVFTGNDLSDQLKRIREPNETIVESLASMHATFYPNEVHETVDEVIEILRSPTFEMAELQYHRYLPWVLHTALFRVCSATKDNSLSYKEGKKNVKKTYDELLKSILEREWLMSWHWRAILPSLRDHDPNDPKRTLVMQISHVRKWEILLCYSVSKDDLNEYEIREIPLKEKNLLRAPIFGLSHRLKGWDTYRHFYHPEVIEYVVAEKKQIDKQKTRKRLEEAYILGRHDCYYIVEKLTSTKTKYTWKLRVSVSPQPEHVLIDKDLFGDEKYYRSTDFVEIPSFADHEGIPQLLSSDNYCEAFLELTEVFNDPTAKSVLLIAPPGTGKEKLAESAFYCRDRSISKKTAVPTGEFVSTSLAGLNAVEAAKLLFQMDDESLRDLNYAHPDGPLGNYNPSAKENRKNGLIFQALDGSLFIDEIDKADRSVRDMLLRVLESGEITVPRSSQTLRIAKHRIPLYVFAGSLNRVAMFQENPPDFWTRISHVIEVAHPLAIDDLERSRKVTKDYLWMFWCIHVKDLLKKKGVEKQSSVANRMKPVNEVNLSLLSFLLRRETVDFASDIIVDELTGRGRPLVSIRTLRSIVARSIYKFIDVLMYSKFDQDPIEVFKELEKEEFRGRSPEEWFGRLSELIKNENYRRSSTCNNKDEKIDFVSYSVVESFRTAIRHGASLVSV